VSDLEKLKDLLFGAEKEVLDSISERVESRDLRSADVADILPEAIHTSHRNGNELTASLREPVGACLQQEFREDPQTYGDALYPVIGPAIRKSIMVALRTFAQQINEAVEQSLTPRGLSWRFQAWRAGVPFGEFVLQKTLLYRVEQTYLISRENGLLVGHAQHAAAKIKDSDAVSAMFTAIQDFVKESFSPDRTGRLESADMGEFTLWAVHGPHALLVCVIRGVPPRQLRTDLSAVLERIHFRYGDAIRSYTGDTATVPDVEEDLEKCLRLEARQEKDDKRKGLSVPLFAVLVLIAAAIAYFSMTSWQRGRDLDLLTSALQQTPGIVITAASADRDGFTFGGIRDPEAATVSSIVASTGLMGTNVEANLRPFRSLEPALIAARAERLFQPPHAISFVVEGTRLVALGPAPLDWQARVNSSYQSLAGIESVEFRMSPAERARLLQQVELERLAADVEALAGRQFFFTANTDFTAASTQALEPYVLDLENAEKKAADLGVSLAITVVGHSDGVGGPEINQVVARKRADAVAGRLAQAGVTSVISTRWQFTDSIDEASIDPSQRRVTMELEVLRQLQSQ